MKITLPSIAKITLGVLLALLLLIIAAGGIALGLIASQPGTQWLANHARHRLGDSVAWQELEGSLLGPLQLRGVHISQPGLEVEARSVSFDWQPRDLFNIRLQITNFLIEDLRVVLSPSEPQASNTPFNPASIQLPLDIAVQGFELRNVEIIQGDAPAQRIDRLTLSAKLEGDEVSLQPLALHSPQGSLNLSLDTALRKNMPVLLNATWDWQPAPATAGSEMPLNGDLSITGNIDWADAIAFNLHYRLLADGVAQLNQDLPPQLNVEGDLVGDFAGKRLGLEQLTMALPPTALQLRFNGELTLADDTQPGFDLSVTWADLQWPLGSEAPQFNSSQGELHLAGSSDNYRLLITTDVAGMDIPQSHWRASGTGDSSRMQLEELRGKLLGGELGATGWVEWSPFPRWELQVEGSDLSPEQLAPELSGQLSLALHSTGQVAPDQAIKANVQLEHLGGQLRDRPLWASAQFAVSGEDLQLQSLALRSEGNQLTASGTVSAELLSLQWQLDAPAPEALIPGAAGHLTASGAVSGNPQQPQISANLQGQNMQLNTLALPRLEARLSAGLGADDPLDIYLSTGTLLDGDQVLLQSLQVDARGKTSQHQFSLAADRGSEQLQVGLAGGVDEQFTRWHGELAKLSVHSEQYGNWDLGEASALALAADKATLERSCLYNSSTPAQLCADAAWSQQKGSNLQASLQSLPISLFLVTASGDLSGDLKASLTAEGALRTDSSLSLSPGQISVDLPEGVEPLTHGGGTVDLSINDSGFTAQLNFAAPRNGTLDANIQLPAFNSLPLTQPQALRGHVQATLPDLGWLAAWVPALASSSGRLNADLALAGSLEQPQLLGQLALVDGAVDIPVAGLTLRDIQLSATPDSEQPGQMDISGGMTSGPGRVDISGRADLQQQSVALQIKGEKLQVFNTADGSALLSPDLQIRWTDNILKLRGQLLIPQAAITPQLGLSPSTLSADSDVAEIKGQIIAPSSDVIILDEELDAAPALALQQAPFSIDSQVKLALGDNVRVNALGFISRITGAVTFINSPQQTELIPQAKGLLSAEEGTFRAFGQDLDIQTGQLIFANVPATEPELNLRAVRWIDNDPQVTAAGVLVTGTVTEPNLELFSRPQLEPSEVQSYLLTGRSSANQDTVLSYGLYLYPRFYVGYGFSLLESTSEFNSLFTITPRYGVSANVGEADNNINLTFTYEN